MSAEFLTEFTSSAKYRDEDELLSALIAQANLSEAKRAAISARAAELVRRIRAEAKPSLMEHFLAEYGLSSREGVALMCLAEAMLRVPDKSTMDALIEDKIAPSDWGKHLGTASSSLVNASTWALMLTGKVLEEDQAGLLRRMIRRMGEPVIRSAVARAMKEMGRQFVLGQSIEDALARAKKREDQGFSYSYDMLGEAAMTAADAKAYAKSYEEAIAAISKACTKGSVQENPGISIKLSALHPRYEVAQEERVMAELVPVVLRLAQAAKAAGMGMNIDAEEQDRLVLSLKVIRAVLSDPSLAGWEGFGVVVQAYGKRAGLVIDWLYALAQRLDRRIMVRLVKGAYWDSEIKRAQVEGLPDFSLFTSKAATDVSYIANAQRLISYADRIYPQFATHNAHTVAAILEMVGDISYEFQRLHGMGERLHDIVLREGRGRCRIYAPVGAHRDLLAYLVRRLLENGANSSFVNQIVDESISPEEVARDPFAALALVKPSAALRKPDALYGAARRNSKGFDLSDEESLREIFAARDIALPKPQSLDLSAATGTLAPIINPSTGEKIAQVLMLDRETALRAIEKAKLWAVPARERAEVLRHAADLYEEHCGEIFALLAQEAGKTLADAVGELREAVDFLRYYAQQGESISQPPRGVIAAISPWNFPLAIFTGQIAAALMAGNGVLAKPAEATPLIAAFAVQLLHMAGVPSATLQLLLGEGAIVGDALTAHPKINGVVFTGSTATAQSIAKSMAEHLAVGTPLIAETGGLNAMVVDSTALPEQAVRDIVTSAFRSAGQRCSALRCLYVQEDIVEPMIEMIKGAMDELRLGEAWALTSDIGPVIDAKARDMIEDYLAANQSKILHQLPAPKQGSFIGPCLLEVKGIADLEREIFGPVLHIARFRAEDLDQVVQDINARGYGLTFGLHTRIDARVQEISQSLHAGNIYVNRNQIGAIVGSQPFGGEGLSGTGPKAGGPNYLSRFYAPETLWHQVSDWSREAQSARLIVALQDETRALISEQMMPGPTGELNRLSIHARSPLVCLGPGPEAAAEQRRAVEALGGRAISAEGYLLPEALRDFPQLSGVLWWGGEVLGRAYAKALALREGPIVPLIRAMPDLAYVAHERHLCVDTTAAGGNAALLAGLG